MRGTPLRPGGSRFAFGLVPSVREAAGGLRIVAVAVLAAALAALAAPAPVQAWGARTHEIINRRAVERMPDDAHRAWQVMAVPLGRHASDADNRKAFDRDERTRHFIDIDVFEPYPFQRIPHTLDGMRRKYGAEEAVKWGVAPWAVDECYRMLVLSLRRGDWASAGAWGADLGHYVADTHQPLHVTMNYDGQKTGNTGIHLRFEVRMMDSHFDEASIEPLPLPDPGKDVVGFTLGWIAEAYAGHETILKGDDAARAVDPGYGPRYLDALWDATHEVAEAQVSRSVRDLAALYTAAWREAGSPPGPETAPAFRALPVEVLDPPSPAGGRSGLRAMLLAGGVLASALLFVSL